MNSYTLLRRVKPHMRFFVFRTISIGMPGGMIWLQNYFTNISEAIHRYEFSILLFNTLGSEKILWEVFAELVDMKINTTLSEAFRHALGLIGRVRLGGASATSLFGLHLVARLDNDGL